MFFTGQAFCRYAQGLRYFGSGGVRFRSGMNSTRLSLGEHHILLYVEHGASIRTGWRSWRGLVLYACGLFKGGRGPRLCPRLFAPVLPLEPFSRSVLAGSGFWVGK